MTITSIPADDRYERFVATGGQTVFPYNFPIYADGDITVSRERTGTATTLVYGVDYTVSGAGTDAGGNVTLTTGATAADVIVLQGTQAIARSTAFASGGDFLAAAVNAEFNRITIVLQQLLRGQSRSLVLPPTDPIMTMELPKKASRLGKVLGFDAITGAPAAVAAPGPSGLITSDYMATLLTAGDASTARGSLGAVASADVISAIEGYFIGSFSPFAGAAAPAGWLLCDGRNVSRTTYARLFTAIGTEWGAGDGVTTFTLPDLRGRALFGRDDMGGTAANRITAAISGITGTTRGATGGDQRMQSHTHGVTDPGHLHRMSDASGIGDPNAAGIDIGIANNTNGVRDTQSATTGITIQTAGAGGSQNMPPAAISDIYIFAGTL